MTEITNSEAFDNIQDLMARTITAVSEARDTYVGYRDEYRATRERFNDEKIELKRAQEAELDEMRQRHAAAFAELEARADEAVSPMHETATEALRHWRSEVVTATQKGSVVSKTVLDKMDLTVPRGERP